MKVLGNLLWWLFGGLEAAIGYFTGSLAMAISIIGIPFAKQHFKMAGLSLAPFGKDVELHIQRTMEKFKDVISGDQLVLVDFFATWCQPCKMMHPILERVKEVLGDRIRIIKVDVDKYGVTANRYGIQSVPTLMLFRHGEVLWRTSGVVQKAELLATIDPFLR